MKIKRLIIALALLMLPTSALAGWVFTEQADDDGEQEKIFIQAGKLAVGQSENAIQTVFDTKSGQLLLINHQSKTYWQGTPQEMKSGMSSAMDAAIAQQTKDMPPEQAAQYKAMMQAMKEQMTNKPAGQAPRPKVGVAKEGDGGKVAGYDTVKYAISQDGQVVAWYWVAPDLDLSDEFDMANMLEMMDGFNPEPDYSTDPALIAVFEKGYPLKVVELDQGQENVIEQKAAVEEKNLPAALFQAPAGYKRGDLASVAGDGQ